MDAEHWRQVERLYHDALEQEEGERAAFLEQACAGDVSLREEVESLLSFAGGADSYLRAAVGEVASQAAGIGDTKARQSETVLDAPRKLGRYELLGRIGKGGMGVVYRAMDTAIGRMVAIKTILFNDADGRASELRVRMVRESQAGGRLSHQNIVAVHDIGQEGDTSFIVMEFVEGDTLDRVMCNSPSLRASGEALRIVQDCAAALDYAHSRGVVHRDIKPANIMLQTDGVVKIADFGIAKVSQFSALTQTAVTMGSPEYMAPEQWRGEAVTGQSDQYALATVAYVLLTGRRPFEGDSVASLAAMTLYQEPPAAATFNSRLSPAVDGVLRKALSKTGAARYPTCSEFARELRRAWDTVPGATPRRENRKWVVAALVAALLVALSSAGLLPYLRHAGGNAKPRVETARSAVARPVNSLPEVDPKLRGEALFQQSAYAEAAEYFTKAIATKPDYRSYFGRAGAYRRLEQMEKAVADYSQAIGFKPDGAAAYHDRAFCEMRLGFLDKAAEDYERALTLDPENSHSWYDRGSIHLKKGGYKHAVQCFTKAIELDPTFVQAWESRAFAERKLKDNEAAEADLKRAHALKQRQVTP
jgi:serine/threonine protein kinase/Tfp pilus assembly protein PilF